MAKEDLGLRIDFLAVCRPVWSIQLTYGCVTIKTSLGNARNYINGYIPDVLIAIGGGAGTFSEVASAHANNIPIVFLKVNGVVNTVDLMHNVLQDPHKRKKAVEFRQAIEATFSFNERQRLYSPDLDSTLSHLITSNQCNVATSAQDAVKLAIDV